MTDFAPSCDGWIRSTAATFSGARGASTGALVNTAGTTMQAQVDASGSGSTTYGIDRIFLAFDTSSLPDNAIVTAAVLTLYVDSETFTGNLALVQGSQASGTTLATSDFGSVGSTEFTDSRVAQSAAAGGTARVFTLNAAGLAAISTTGYTKLAVRQSWDQDNSDPGASAYNYRYLVARSSEYTGTTHDPVLSVTYTLPSGAVYARRPSGLYVKR